MTDDRHVSKAVMDAALKLSDKLKKNTPPKEDKKY
jgi:hypothetical protein